MLTRNAGSLLINAPIVSSLAHTHDSLDFFQLNYLGDFLIGSRLLWQLIFVHLVISKDFRDDFDQQLDFHATMHAHLTCWY